MREGQKSLAEQAHHNKPDDERKRSSSRDSLSKGNYSIN